jgi:UDP-4-amino-4,6-dideoxy-N-acetyl-beta-L-altrosamine transaminase
LTRAIPLPYGRQAIDKNDVDAVVEALNGDWLTQGPGVAKFEQLIAEYCGAKYAVAVSSGTAALHLANLVLGVKPGAKVLTTPISFVATSNAIIYAGGEPIFCDIDPYTINIDPAEVLSKISQTEDIVGIAPVHLAGVVADMESLNSIAKDNGLWILEDACHAIGGKWTDSRGVEHSVGDCSFSDMTVFSFHPVKHITTGEGGAVTTNSKEFYQKLIELRSHGITKNPESISQPDEGWFYEMQSLGFNYRLTDIQAALGSTQLSNSDRWAKRRNELVSRYDQSFSELPTVKPQNHPGTQMPSYHLYIIRAKDRRALYDYLRKKKIYTQVHYIPIHLHPYYQDKYGTGPGQFPMAEAYYHEALSLPLFPSMLDEDQMEVIKSVKRFYEED